MAHEIEKNNAFFVQKPAWHRLGVVLPEAPKIDEAIKFAGLDWRVDLKPLVLADGTPVTTHKATVRSSDNTVLGVVGGRYEPLQNIEAFNFFQPFLDAGVAKLESAGSLREGKRVWVLAKLATDPSVIKGNDTVEKYVLLSNSHDGTLAIRVGFTPIRVVCANTLAMAHNADASKLIKVRHSQNNVQNLENIRDIMNVASQQFEATMEQFRLLANTEISQASLEAYVRIVFGIATDVSVSQSRIMQQILPLFEGGRGNNIREVRGTYFAAYNSVQEYLQDTRGRNENNRLDSLWFGQGAVLNQKALKVAVEMAAA